MRLFNLPLEGWNAASPEYRRRLAAFRPDLVGISVWAVSWKSCVAAIEVVW